MHDVKLANLRGNLVLGDQIYGLEALNSTGNDWMSLAYGGLDELFMQLGELVRGPKPFLLLGKLDESRRWLSELAMILGLEDWRTRRVQGGTRRVER